MITAQSVISQRDDNRSEKKETRERAAGFPFNLNFNTNGNLNLNGNNDATNAYRVRPVLALIWKA